MRLFMRDQHRMSTQWRGTDLHEHKTVAGGEEGLGYVVELGHGAKRGQA